MAKFIAIALFCILGASLSKAFNKEEAIKEFMEFSEVCINEVGATKADIDELIKQKPASGKEGKCYRACLMKKYKVMDDSGKFVKAAAIDHAKAITNGDAEKMKVANEIIDVCSATDVPADACEAAEAYGKCLKEQSEAHGINKKDFFN